MAYLEIQQGFNAGMIFYINDDTTVGRSPENDLCLPDSRASRKHARLHIEGKTVSIVDMNSGNGTFLNDRRLAPNTPYPLQEGDLVRISSTELVFHDPTAGVGTKKSSTVLAAIMTPEEEDRPAIGATIDASQSMIDLPRVEEQTPQKLLQTLARLQAMVKVSNDLASVTGQVPLLEKIMHSIFDIFPNADRAFVMMPDEETGKMSPFLGRNRHTIIGRPEDFTISSTIVDNIVEKRQSILSSDAQSDKRFGGSDSVVNLRIRSMMAAPFISQEEMLGILHVDTITSTRAFTREDLEMITGIASQAAVLLKNAELYEQVQEETERRTILSRYTSPDIVQRILEGKISLDMRPKTAHGTVVFCDILGFTSMSEHMSPVEVVDRLNRYYRLTTRIVTEHNGTLHKFGGDMIMAFWNVMFEDPEHEYNAAMTGLDLQRAIWCYDLGLLQEGQPPIYMGVGCNTGDFAAGDVGGQHFVEYTVIGDNVNTAQRIETLAGRWQVLLSESSYQSIADRAIAVQLPSVKLKGRSLPVKIFSIRGLRRTEDESIMCMPVGILAADGNHAGLGIITRLFHGGAEPMLELLTATHLDNASAVVLQLKAQEVNSDVKVGARVQEEETCHDGHAEYQRYTLASLRGSDIAMKLFALGSCFATKKSWEEMRRQ